MAADFNDGEGDGDAPKASRGRLLTKTPRSVEGALDDFIARANEKSLDVSAFDHATRTQALERQIDELTQKLAAAEARAAASTVERTRGTAWIPVIGAFVLGCVGTFAFHTFTKPSTAPAMTPTPAVTSTPSQPAPQPAPPPPSPPAETPAVAPSAPTPMATVTPSPTTTPPPVPSPTTTPARPKRTSPRASTSTKAQPATPTTPTPPTTPTTPPANSPAATDLYNPF